MTLEERLDELELRQKQLLQNFTDTVNAIAAVREIKNLDQILNYLLKQQNRHAHVLESLLIKAGCTKGELVELFQQADVDFARARLDWQLKQNSSDA